MIASYGSVPIAMQTSTVCLAVAFAIASLTLCVQTQNTEDYVLHS